MEKIKNILKEIFINGLSGMAAGLFATLIIGTIIKQIGSLIPGTARDYLSRYFFRLFFLLPFRSLCVRRAGLNWAT